MKKGLFYEEVHTLISGRRLPAESLHERLVAVFGQQCRRFEPVEVDGGERGSRVRWRWTTRPNARPDACRRRACFANEDDPEARGTRPFGKIGRDDSRNALGSPVAIPCEIRAVRPDTPRRSKPSRTGPPLHQDVLPPRSAGESGSAAAAGTSSSTCSTDERADGVALKAEGAIPYSSTVDPETRSSDSTTLLTTPRVVSGVPGGSCSTSGSARRDNAGGTSPGVFVSELTSVATSWNWAA